MTVFMQKTVDSNSTVNGLLNTIFNCIKLEVFSLLYFSLLSLMIRQFILVKIPKDFVALLET